METKPSRPQLSEHNAWKIATAWQPHIQGRVRLLVDRDGPVDSIRESYAWIRLDEPRALVAAQPGDANHRREVVSVMRAVMETWATLAACPGYGGSENHVFWKRVINELHMDRERPRRPGCVSNRDLPKTVTDANGFSDLAGHTFPRFMVATPSTLDEQFGKLLTNEGPDLVPEVRAKLKAILADLEPFQGEPVRLMTPVDVSLRLRWIAFSESDAMAFTTLLRVVNDPRRGSSEYPSFQICQIHKHDVMSLHYEEGIDGFLRFVRALPCRVGDLHLSPLLNKVGSDNIARWLRAFLRLEDDCLSAKVTSCSVARSRINDAIFQALMSAMPFTKSVHTTWISTERSQADESFERSDMPWIAYAIFHPKTASSTWKHLELTDLTLTKHSSYILSVMARGNNLLALLNGTPPTCDAYYSAELAPGTVVRLEPGFQGPQVLRRSKLEELCVVPSGKPLEVDVCGISSLDRASWGKWVAVIVPAYGLGWVCAYDLHNVRSRSPSTTSLSGLMLSKKHKYRPNSPPDDRPEVLLHVLQPLGSMLTYLDISSYASVSSSTLSEILRACPSLKSLIVSHDAQLWSQPMELLDGNEAQLEELELRVSSSSACIQAPSLEHITTSLRNVRAIRFSMWDKEGEQMMASRPALELLLRHATALEYVHWRNPLIDFVRPVSYCPCTQQTPKALELLRLTDKEFQYAHQPLTRSCAAALLSVVTRSSGSALRSIVDRGVVSTIFLFAGSLVRRFIHIEPSAKDSKSGTS